MNDYLDKPVKLKDLQQMLRKITHAIQSGITPQTYTPPQAI